jgi:ADP-ribose pyrophosphatase YjhB (NUDIX family)
MNTAARAIIIENNNLLVMQRNKQGMIYYTLVGGMVSENETPEQAVMREVQEETGLTVTNYRLVYTEKHPAPYNSQYIYLCEVAPHESIGLTLGSEEEKMNRHGINMHTPYWAPLRQFDKIQFRTPAVQKAILSAIKKGFPNEPTAL